MTGPPSPGLEGAIDSLDPPYRSRGEARVGRILDRYGIAFFYEQPTLLYDRGRYRVWCPDFTLPQYNGLIIEYAGMMDIPDYARGIAHKQQAYAANAIPAMFVYPQDVAKPGWAYDLVGRIEQSAYELTNRDGDAHLDRPPYR